jgi:hypothetical protein
MSLKLLSRTRKNQREEGHMYWRLVAVGVGKGVLQQ